MFPHIYLRAVRTALQTFKPHMKRILSYSIYETVQSCGERNILQTAPDLNLEHFGTHWIWTVVSNYREIANYLCISHLGFDPMGSEQLSQLSNPNSQLSGVEIHLCQAFFPNLFVTNFFKRSNLRSWRCKHTLSGNYPPVEPVLCWSALLVMIKSAPSFLL